ncbi:MAG: GAF domain-containing sensor histidine kinase [Armatimonadota bacterium]
MMRKFETPFTADWFAISIRWIILVGLIVSLGLGQRIDIVSMWPLGIMMILNLTMTMLANSNVRITFFRYSSVLLDLILAGELFLIQGGLRGPAFWAGLLPILTGSIYFGFFGALITSLLFSGLVYYIGTRVQGDFSLTLIIIGALTGLSLVFGLLGRRMMVRMRENRTLGMDAEEKKSAIENERMRAIYDLISTLSSTLSYKRVLDSALDMSATALNPDLEQSVDDPLVGAILLFNDGKLQIGSARRFTNTDMRATFDGAEGVLKRVLDQGDPITFKDIGYDPELGHVVALRNCVSGYCFPLRSGLNVYGVMLFAHPEPDYFNPERLKLLDIIGRQAVIAIQNARLYQDLVDEKERMVEVHEEARKKLARDLHDGPTQSIAAMAMRLNITKRLMAKDVKSAYEEIVKLEELAQRTTKEIRHMLFTLRPLILESQGLNAAVQYMADIMMETYAQKVVVNIDQQVATQMEMGKQGVIFYIIEEAVNNARKHASAEAITVRLRELEKGIVLLEILDNGVGFDVKSMSQNYESRANSSLGMVNLRERAELVNGLLQINSAPGQGTKVQVYIPLTEEAADRLNHPQKNK